MIINSLDMGSPSHPFAAPILGQTVGSVVVEGSETIVWPRGSIERKQTVSFWIKAWQGLGGQAAGSSGAMKYLLKQVEELASSRDLQPVYIQWTASADPAAQLNATELHDGWYVIDDFEPNYSRNVVTGLVECRMTVTEVAAAAPRSVALAYQGAALSTNFSGAALNLISLPVGSTALEANFTRTAAEGSIPCILSPVASPEPTVLSATLANIFKGGVHVYDTINTGSNPVPTANGTFVNANWVEVFFSDHDFQGDCVITNGLQLLIFVQGSAHVCSAYVWNTALASANWQKYADVNYQDVAGNIGTLQGYALSRIGAEEASLVTVSSTSGNKNAQVRIRLQRGRYEARADLMPSVEASTTNTSLTLVAIATPKIIYNSTKIADVVLSETSPAFPTDYGYGAGFIANSADPFIFGFLYQNESGNAQPYDVGNVATVGLGDNTSLAAGAQRSYGFWAVPYGVNASYSTANLQTEVESLTLSGAAVSTADAAASAGNACKIPSGTAVAGARALGSLAAVAAGTYIVACRVRSGTNGAGTNTEVRFAFIGNAGATFFGTTLLKPNQVTTAYKWFQSAPFTLTGTLSGQFVFDDSGVAGAASVDWFGDEMVLLPVNLSVANTGPQDIYQQWAFDRSARLIRP